MTSAGWARLRSPDRDYTMAEYAEDAIGLLDALGWERCHVMGVSFGGMVSQEIAIRHPKRVDRVVMACSSSGGAGSPSYPLHHHLSDTLEERGERQVALSDVRRDAAWRAAHAEEYETLVEQTLAGARIGADETGRAEGYRRQITAQERPRHVRSAAGHQRAGLHLRRAVRRHRADGEPGGAEAADPRRSLELFEGGHAFLNEDPRAHRARDRVLERASWTGR